MKTGTKYLSEFNKEIEMMFLFWKRNNLDMVNSIIEDIENEFDSIFLYSFYLTETNEEYRMYDIDFVNYVHNIHLKYIMWRIVEI
jgi:hypothetical protein